MAKKFTSDEILKMAVGLLPSDPDADLDSDGKVTSSDARYQGRLESGKLPLDSVSLMAENVVNKIIKNSDSFSYDAVTDPIYSRYRKMYEEAGDRAYEDALGKAVALTGGYGNSYASKIASDERKEYADLSLDKAQELEENAYKRHSDSVDRLYSLYELMKSEEKREEDKKKAAVDFAVTASNMGDDSFIKALGIDPKDSDFQKLKENAELSAKYGDYSGLESLGIDVSKLQRDEKFELAELFAKYGDYSLLSGLGVNTSNRETEDYYDRLIKRQKVW